MLVQGLFFVEIYSQKYILGMNINQQSSASNNFAVETHDRCSGWRSRSFVLTNAEQNSRTAHQAWRGAWLCIRWADTFNAEATTFWAVNGRGPGE